MTLMLNLNTDVLCTKIKIIGQNIQKVRARTGQTETHTENISTSHSPLSENSICATRDIMTLLLIRTSATPSSKKCMSRSRLI